MPKKLTCVALFVSSPRFCLNEVRPLRDGITVIGGSARDVFVHRGLPFYPAMMFSPF